MKKLSRGAYNDTKGFVRVIQIVFEVAVMTGIYYIIWRWGYRKEASFGYLYKGKYVLMGLYALILTVFFHNSDCTMFGRLRLSDLAIGQLVALLLVNFITYIQLCLMANRAVTAGPMIAVWAVEAAAAVGLLLLYHAIYLKLYAPHDMLLICGTSRGLTLKFKMNARPEKYRITEVLLPDAPFEKICSRIRAHDSVVLNEVPVQLRDDILTFCYRYRIRTYVVPELTDIMLRGGDTNPLFDVPMLVVKGTGLSPTQRIVKRAMDLILCSLAMIPAAPIMLAAALAIKLEDGGPVFFRQDRLTRWGREFEILKFRSMVVNAEQQEGPALATEDDPRITKVGKFLRATRLDELPQLLNILRGDMSIVGPRPERKCFAEEFAREIPEFPYRLKVRGGLTGYAQIYGKYNTSAYDKLRLDLTYIENYSLLLDIRLMILTLRVIFSRDSTEGADVAEETEEKAERLMEELKKKNRD